jgi:hypothetical protein
LNAGDLEAVPVAPGRDHDRRLVLPHRRLEQVRGRDRVGVLVTSASTVITSDQSSSPTPRLVSATNIAVYSPASVDIVGAPSSDKQARSPENTYSVIDAGTVCETPDGDEYGVVLYCDVDDLPLTHFETITTTDQSTPHMQRWHVKPVRIPAPA